MNNKGKNLVTACLFDNKNEHFYSRFWCLNDSLEPQMQDYSFTKDRCPICTLKPPWKHYENPGNIHIFNRLPVFISYL